MNYCICGVNNWVSVFKLWYSNQRWKCGLSEMDRGIFFWGGGVAGDVAVSFLSSLCDIEQT